MSKNSIDTLPFPASLVFPDVDPDVLDDEGLQELQALNCEHWLGFADLVHSHAMLGRDGFVQSAASA